MMYRVGHIGLLAPEVELLKTILRSSSILAGRWTLVDSGACDAVITYITNQQLDGYQVTPKTVRIYIKRRGEERTGFTFFKPFRADELIEILQEIEYRKHTSVIENESAAINFSYKLNRWPPSALLAQDKRFNLLAAYLSRHSITEPDLVNISGFSHNFCSQFLNLLDSNRLLTKTEVDSIKLHSAQQSSNPQLQQKKGLLTKLRQRLGII